MDLALLVYVISVVASIKIPLIIGTIVLGLSFIGLTIAKMVYVAPSDYDRKYKMEEYTETKNAINRWWKISVVKGYAILHNLMSGVVNKAMITIK